MYNIHNVNFCSVIYYLNNVNNVNNLYLHFILNKYDKFTRCKFHT